MKVGAGPLGRPRADHILEEALVTAAQLMDTATAMSDTPSAVGDLERTLDALGRAEQRDFDGVMRIFGPASVWDLTRWGLGHHADG